MSGPTHHGFRVSAQARFDSTYVEDTFELKQCALQCAALLIAGGWEIVDVHEITENKLGRKYTPIDWRELA